MIKKTLIISFGLVVSFAGTVEAEVTFISGVQPDQRPANAPVIAEVKKNSEWYKKALTGVTPPYPSSLKFLESQGNWYIPFTRPGMVGYYDIRGWHSTK